MNVRTIVMKLFQPRFFYGWLLALTLLVSGCGRHPASGVWKATGDNAYGIEKLVVGFDGRAEFVTTKLDNASWHCFWGATASREAKLSCKPSDDPEKEEYFTLLAIEVGNGPLLAELRHNNSVVAEFVLQDENPTPVE